MLRVIAGLGLAYVYKRGVVKSTVKRWSSTLVVKSGPILTSHLFYGPFLGPVQCLELCRRGARQLAFSRNLQHLLNDASAAGGTCCERQHETCSPPYSPPDGPPDRAWEITRGISGVSSACRKPNSAKSGQALANLGLMRGNSCPIGANWPDLDQTRLNLGLSWSILMSARRAERAPKMLLGVMLEHFGAFPRFCPSAHSESNLASMFRVLVRDARRAPWDCSACSVLFSSGRACRRHTSRGPSLACSISSPEGGQDRRQGVSLKGDHQEWPSRDDPRTS